MTSRSLWAVSCMPEHPLLLCTGWPWAVPQGSTVPGDSPSAMDCCKKQHLSIYSQPLWFIWEKLEKGGAWYFQLGDYGFNKPTVKGNMSLCILYVNKYIEFKCTYVCMSVYVLYMYLYIHRHSYMDIHIYIGAYTYNVHTGICILIYMNIDFLDHFFS